MKPTKEGINMVPTSILTHYRSQSQNEDQVICTERAIPRTEFEFITPETAKEYLELNKTNRRIRPGVVMKYAADMAAGRWRLTHQGIAFDRDMNLIDGQHRLLAVIRSGCSIQMAVTYGLDRECHEVVDGGALRSVKDVLHFEGVIVSNTQTGIATRLLVDLKSGPTWNATRAQVTEMFYRHEEAIREVTSWVGTHRKRITVASVLSPVVRAWYSQDRDRLQMFVSLLASGYTSDPAPEDRSVILLREWLERGKSRAGWEAEREIYFKTERALQAFLDHQPLSKLYSATEELFLLPEEIADSAIIPK